MSDQIKAALAILRRRQLEKSIGLGRSSIYAKLDPRSSQYDPSFPKPIRLGERAVGWFSHQVDEWLIDQANKQAATKGEKAISPSKGISPSAAKNRGDK